MATYQSRDDVFQAYRSLLKLEQRLGELLEQEELDPEAVGDVLNTQSEIMDAIDDADDLDHAVRENRPGEVRALMEEFSRLRDEHRESMQDYADELESVIESLDQAHELLKHYLQGEPRSGEDPSQRFDREA